MQDEEDPAQRLPVRHPRSALGLLRTRLRQQRPDQRPQFIRHDPRPRLTISHNQTYEQSGRQPHDQQLLLEPVKDPWDEPYRDLTVAVTETNRRLRALVCG
ncbi:hypothetical protein GCM10023177_42980 [Streptomyces violaceoruber]|nr:hypothetical protein JCM4020_01270 [Streptomyces coelicolor]